MQSSGWRQTTLATSFWKNPLLAREREGRREEEPTWTQVNATSVSRELTTPKSRSINKYRHFCKQGKLGAVPGSPRSLQQRQASLAPIALLLTTFCDVCINNFFFWRSDMIKMPINITSWKLRASLLKEEWFLRCYLFTLITCLQVGDETVISNSCP